MKITVKAGGPDRRVPMEPRRVPPAYFLMDDKGNGLPATVELTAYIQRRVDCGDLVECDEKGNPIVRDEKGGVATPPAPAAAAPAKPAAAPAAKTEG